jgi:hypothetical protein
MPEESQIEDYWPDLDAAAVATPASILKTQAAALSRKSKGLLQAEVETFAKGAFVHHRLVIVVPALENYRYSLLSIHHPATLYPVYVDEEPELPGEAVSSYQAMGGLQRSFERALQPLTDQDRFRAWLQNALARDETKRILESLMAQAAA